MFKICRSHFVRFKFILRIYNKMSLNEVVKSCCQISNIENVTIVREGQGEILVTEKNVFYNPVQEFNRDLSILVLTEFAKKENFQLENVNNRKDGKIKYLFDKNNGITVLDALAATGLRSIRYAKEVPNIKLITANDISLKAVESMKQNIKHNNIGNIVQTSHEDATFLMCQNRKSHFDAIDLDPYGCPAIFLDSAVQCASEGGLLLVTATDMAILAGNFPESCYVKYGAISLKTKACHEVALRILLQAIASHAGRYGRYIRPLLSVSVDFYIRVFVQIFTSQKKCKENSSRIGMVYQCNGCETQTIQPLSREKSSNRFALSSAPTVDQHCKYCGCKHQMGGPIWLGPLHNKEFVSKLLQNLNDTKLGTAKRIQGILSVVKEELDVPLYYTLERIMSIVKSHTPSMVAFRSAILNAGYDVSYSHACKTSIKTNAPNSVIWDIVRAWVKENSMRLEKFSEESPGLAILKYPSTISVSFKEHPAANPESRKQHLVRFQQNPIQNWGPGTRSKTRVLDDEEKQSKKERNQNKHSKKQRLGTNSN